MMQVGRNLLDAVDGFLLGKGHFILDRDPLYTRAFRRLLRDFGVNPLLLPARSSNLKAYAERFVRSIRDVCLNHVIIEPFPVAVNTKDPVQRQQRLGGLLTYYHHEAA